MIGFRVLKILEVESPLLSKEMIKEAHSLAPEMLWSTLIHGSINSSRIDTFRRRLSEGSVYFLSGFDIARSNPKFRLSDSPVSIRFNDETFFETKTDSDKDIPTELFRFRSHEQLLTLANTNRDLPDIVGEVSSVRSTITDGLRGPQRVMMTLRLERDVNVCVSMFDDRAVTFQTKFDEHSSEPKVILFTNINPKVVGEKLFLNATSGTYFYFDCETSAGKEHYERLVGDRANAISSKSKVVPAQKIDP
ncbi:hypothetical protein F2Q68_00019764 [Brassica cretica]|uniref:Uncharacterized protein n=1 Tax=Brassica cretica TaxID=69181 RepID=A0A8S9G1Q1_BRACR|nr:hypothetical protein F2Q68_00019764 [Brassica cretica]